MLNVLTSLLRFQSSDSGSKYTSNAIENWQPHSKCWSFLNSIFTLNYIFFLNSFLWAHLHMKVIKILIKWSNISLSIYSNLWNNWWLNKSLGRVVFHSLRAHCPISWTSWKISIKKHLSNRIPQPVDPDSHKLEHGPSDRISYNWFKPQIYSDSQI